MPLKTTKADPLLELHAKEIGNPDAVAAIEQRKRAEERVRQMGEERKDGAGKQFAADIS